MGFHTRYCWLHHKEVALKIKKWQWVLISILLIAAIATPSYFAVTANSNTKKQTEIQQLHEGIVVPSSVSLFALTPSDNTLPNGNITIRIPKTRITSVVDNGADLVITVKGR